MLVVIFSLLTNSVLSVIFTLGMYIIGHGLQAALGTTLGKVEGLFHTVLSVAVWVMPNFSKFNLREHLLYEQHMPPGYVVTAFFYSTSYAIFLFVLANVIFERKNLD